LTQVDQNYDRGWTLSQRPPRKAGLNPFQPYGFFLEEERSASGEMVDSGTILLTNKECPWRCLMCDLWKNTLTQTVPLGAIPQQIRFAVARWPTQPRQIKLYNSGSFFDSAAIPLGDYRAIAGEVAFAPHVIVESHPRLIGDRALRFRDLLEGSLEVAMGLETIHPRALLRLHKNFQLKHFERAVHWLISRNIEVRAFVLLSPPFIPREKALEWVVKSAAFAFCCGASVVTLIPARTGNGAMDRLHDAGLFIPPSIPMLERASEMTLRLRAGRVFADTWDLERFSTCPACLDQRHRRLESMNLSQTIPAPISCAACSSE
jgi:radical SAM enzyme (TIGR01210 family)